MDLNDLPPAVQKLATIGGEWNEEGWPDYRAMGIGPEHIPALIEIVRHMQDFWEEVVEEVEQPETWTPVHAWRALGQLQAVEAIPALLDSLRLIDEEDFDLLQTEIPETFAAIGPAAIPALTTHIFDASNGMWARSTAAEGLAKIGQKFPEIRSEVVSILMRALERYSEEDTTYNALLIDILMDLRAVEAVPLVEQAFTANRVDESIIGDWEDFQVGIGLLEKRRTPIQGMQSNLPDLFANDTPGLEELRAAQTRVRREEPQTKNKRKQVKASRSKNRTRHKKKN